MTKDVLLQSNYFIDNEFLDKYIQLINENIKTKPIPNKTQSHHIIPRHYFLHNSLDVDNSQENLVNLYFSDHMLAHMYLSGCSIGRDRYWNLYAVFYMSGKADISLDELKERLPQYQQLYEEAIGADYNHRKGTKVSEETRLKMCLAQQELRKLNGGTNKGYIWVHNETKDYMVPKYDLDEYLESGFVKGRLYRHNEVSLKKIADGARSWKRDEEFCKKMSEIASKQIHTDEQNKKHSEWAKQHTQGKDNPFYGKHHSDDSKQKNREAHLGKITVSRDGVIKMIHKDELEFYIEKGYTKGRKG